MASLNVLPISETLDTESYSSVVIGAVERASPAEAQERAVEAAR
jgi:hypothetical protein